MPHTPWVFRFGRGSEVLFDPFEFLVFAGLKILDRACASRHSIKRGWGVYVSRMYFCRTLQENSRVQGTLLCLVETAWLMSVSDTPAENRFSRGITTR